LVVCGFALATSSVPERNQESEQRIASMELNQSAGNMTGEDYTIALIYAYMQDVQNGSSWLNPGPIFRSIKTEALLNFPEYERVYRLLEYGPGSVSTELEEMILVPPNVVSGRRCENMSDVPESNIIEVIQYVFDEGGFMETAQTAYHKRIAEEAESNAARDKRESELKAIQEKKEAERLSKQQEAEAHQTALDDHYKAIYENTTKELEKLESDFRNASDNISKEAKLLDAIRLLNNSSTYLVSPYSNILSISAGNILIEMSTISDDHHKNLMYIAAADECYRNAQNNFTYSNESEEYQNAIHQDFVNKYYGILRMKDGITTDRFTNEVSVFMDDLRDAPNVKQLFSGHIDKKYDVEITNYTDLRLISTIKDSDIIASYYLEHPGYWVEVNLSAYNDPDSNKIDEYVTKNIPIFIDIFSSLFRDNRISVAYIQLNETYYDGFGHTEERPVMQARLDNETATQIGDWSAFKKYVGNDMYRFEQAITVWV